MREQSIMKEFDLIMEDRLKGSSLRKEKQKRGLEEKHR